MLNTIISKIKSYRYRKYIVDLKKMGLKIGQNTHILDGVFLDPSHCFLISIGDNCTLAPNVRMIAHDASMKKYLGVTRIGSIKINDNCFIGDSSIILPGVSIGPNTIIGAGSVVTKDIPPDSVAAGNPARVVMSFDQFIKKHSDNISKYRCFPYEQFNIAVISHKDKEEMIVYMENCMGYIGKKESQMFEK